jgi:hypothetical protein
MWKIITARTKFCAKQQCLANCLSIMGKFIVLSNVKHVHLLHLQLCQWWGGKYWKASFKHSCFMILLSGFSNLFILILWASSVIPLKWSEQQTFGEGNPQMWNYALQSKLESLRMPFLHNLMFFPDNCLETISLNKGNIKRKKDNFPSEFIFSIYF